MEPIAFLFVTLFLPMKPVFVEAMAPAMHQIHVNATHHGNGRVLNAMMLCATISVVALIIPMEKKFALATVTAPLPTRVNAQILLNG